MRVVKHWYRLPREVVEAPSAGYVQGQVRWDSEQPDVPAHCTGLGLDDLWRSLPTQSIL